MTYRRPGLPPVGAEVPVARDEAAPLRYALVIFDMDGTLIEQQLDFSAIKSEIGMPGDADMLRFIEALPEERQAIAYQILGRHEMWAAERCSLFDGAAEAVSELKHRGIRTALLTRNSPSSVECILRRHRLSLDVVSTRENTPYKPHPDSITNIKRELDMQAQPTLMVGDYIYDLQAAHAAGVDSALFWPHQAEAPSSYISLATHVISRHDELLRVVHQPYGHIH